jgi:hypothetical protein
VVGIITRKDLEHAAEHGVHSTPPIVPITASRSLIASTSRVHWRPSEDGSGGNSNTTRRKMSATKLADTLARVEELDADAPGKEPVVRRTARVSGVEELQEAVAINLESDSDDSVQNGTPSQPPDGTDGKSK